MILFTRPYPVIRRGVGAYVEGKYVPAPEAAPVLLQLNVQPGPDNDLICLAAVGTLEPRDELTRHPGDIVIVNGHRHAVISMDRWDSFAGAETAHDKYSLQREIPKAPGEA